MCCASATNTAGNVEGKERRQMGKRHDVKPAPRGAVHSRSKRGNQEEHTAQKEGGRGPPDTDSPGPQVVLGDRALGLTLGNSCRNTQVLAVRS